MHVSLEEAQNHVWHKTEGLSSTSILVVRRGQPFKLTLSFNEPYMSRKCNLMLRIGLGTNIYCHSYTFCLLTDKRNNFSK